VLCSSSVVGECSPYSALHPRKLDTEIAVTSSPVPVKFNVADVTGCSYAVMWVIETCLSQGTQLGAMHFQVRRQDSGHRHLLPRIASPGPAHPVARRRDLLAVGWHRKGHLCKPALASK